MKPVYIVTALLLAHALQAAAAESVPLPLAPAQVKALGIRTQPLESVESTWGTPYPAQVVVPNAQLRVVSAPQAGLLSALLVAEGERVRAGQALAEIHSPQLVEQQGRYLEALTALRLASVELARDEKLAREGIIAERRLLETRARRQQARTGADQYRQALQLAGMDARALDTLARERRLSSSLTVPAPLDGVVLEQLGTPGQRLDVASPLYRIGHLQPLWLEVHVPLEALGSTGPKTRVQVDSPRVEGEVITIGSMVHGVDQGVLVRARIDAGAELLRPGQLVQARLAATGDGSPRFRIPDNALVRNAGQSWVFLQVPGGFRPTPVTIGSAEQGTLVVSGDLGRDDRVAVAGTAALKAAWLESGSDEGAQ